MLNVIETKLVFETNVKTPAQEFAELTQTVKSQIISQLVHVLMATKAIRLSAVKDKKSNMIHQLILVKTISVVPIRFVGLLITMLHVLVWQAILELLHLAGQNV